MVSDEGILQAMVFTIEKTNISSYLGSGGFLLSLDSHTIGGMNVSRTRPKTDRMSWPSTSWRVKER